MAGLEKLESYKVKNVDYFNNVRTDIIRLIPVSEKNKILEIGAGGGFTLAKIKELNLASEVIGLDLLEIPGSFQNHPIIDRFIIANIENSDLDLPLEYFDIIIAADVLEHLYSPEQVVDKLLKFLNKDGILIVSVPNIREIRTLYKIVIKGDFRYEDSGIMDRTHIKFFCKKNIVELLQQSSLNIKRISPSFKLLPGGKIIKFINFISLSLFEDFLAYQYLIIAKKK